MDLEKEKKTINESQKFSLKKQLVIFFTGWIGLKILALIFSTFIVALLKNPSININGLSPSSSAMNMLLDFVVYVLLLVIMATIANKDLKKLLQTNSVIKSILAGVICFFSMMAFNRIYGFITSLLRIEIVSNANEAAIEKSTNLYPISAIIVFGFIGPIVEELTYRVGLFSLCKRKSRLFAYIVTLVFFALIHFDFSSITYLFKSGFSNVGLAYFVNELLNIPYYAFAAFAFTMTFERHGYIASVTGHMLNNLTSVLLQIILNLI